MLAYEIFDVEFNDLKGVDEVCERYLENVIRANHPLV
jgi:hypothetical protein